MANTVIRRRPTGPEIKQLEALLARLRLTADQCSGLVSSLAGCMEGSEYESYGSVDLGDVAQTMQDEIEAFEEPGHCSACNGCGEGQHDGTRCRACKGRGETPSPREIERHNMEIAA